MSAAYRKAAAISLLLACSACVVVPTPAPVPYTARTVTPVGPAALPASGYCREYQQTVMIGGQMQTAHGTSCLQADGTWKLAGVPTPLPQVQAVPAAPAYAAPAYAAPYSGPYIVVPIGPATGENNDRSR